jgi:RNA polymerase sigma factor (sigma-70 family)
MADNELKPIELKPNKLNPIESYKPLIISIIKRLNICETAAASYDDYIQAGYIGIIANFKKYDPLKSSLVTYLSTCIRREVIEQARLLSWRKRSKEVPGREVVCNTELLRTQTGAEDGFFDLDIPDSIDYAELSMNNVLVEQIKNVAISKRQGEVVELVYGRGLTYQKAADTLKISVGGVSSNLDFAIQRYRVALGLKMSEKARNRSNWRGSKKNVEKYCNVEV